MASALGMVKVLVVAVQAELPLGLVGLVVHLEARVLQVLMAVFQMVLLVALLVTQSQALAMLH